VTPNCALLQTTIHRLALSHEIDTKQESRAVNVDVGRELTLEPGKSYAQPRGFISADEAFHNDNKAPRLLEMRFK
jgi:hypothetical protein